MRLPNQPWSDESPVEILISDGPGQPFHPATLTRSWIWGVTLVLQDPQSCAFERGQLVELTVIQENGAQALELVGRISHLGLGPTRSIGIDLSETGIFAAREGRIETRRRA